MKCAVESFEGWTVLEQGGNQKVLVKSIGSYKSLLVLLDSFRCSRERGGPVALGRFYFLVPCILGSREWSLAGIGRIAPNNFFFISKIYNSFKSFWLLFKNENNPICWWERN